MRRMWYENPRRILIRKYRADRVRHILLQRIQKAAGADLPERRKLKSTMTDEQKELFEKYTDCVREHQAITDCLIFQNSFKLGAMMMLEVMDE